MIDVSILFELFLMLLFGKILGDIVHRLGFSPLIGQIIAGILLGPMILQGVALSPSLDELSNLGIIFMMFLMGLSVDFEKVMSENVYKASLISICGGMLTFFAATTITTLLGFELNTALLVGISFISTSTAIGFMVLMDIGDDYSKVFKTVMAVGTTDDILAILALAIFIAYINPNGTGVDLRSVVNLFLLLLGFIIFILWFGRSFSEKLISMTVNSSDEQSVISVSLIILFLVAYLSDNIMGAAVTGAFLAGTILARSQFSHKIITPKIQAISEGFFVPIFFVYTGVRINFLQMVNSVPLNLMGINIPIDVFLFLGLVMVVMTCKYVATYAATLILGGYRASEINKISLAMMPMGEYTLVIGQIGLVSYGLLLAGMTSVYSVMALVVLVTSILTPILLRTAYEH